MISPVQEVLSDQRNGMTDCHTTGRSPKEVIVKLGRKKTQKSKRFRV